MKLFSRLILFVLLVVLLVSAVSVMAQEVTVEPTAEVTPVITPDPEEPEPTPEATEEPPFVIVYPGAPGQPDLTPVIDDYAAREAVYRSSVGVIGGLLSVVIIALLKYILPGRHIDTETIYKVVIGGFTLLYAGAEVFNATEQLQAGTDLLTSMAGPIWSLALTILTGQEVFGRLKKTNTPLFTEKQGEDWLEFKKPGDAEFDPSPYRGLTKG